MRLHFLAFIGLTAAEISQCSTQNTGSSNTNHYNMYQSNGYCTDQCTGYAYAVVEGANCWCSNVAPGTTIDLNNCQVNCPGYPSEKCGDSSQGYFAYVQIGTPSSTAGGSTLVSTGSSTPSPSTSATTSATTTSSSTSSTSTNSNIDTTTASASTSSNSNTDTSAASTSTSTQSNTQPSSTSSQSSTMKSTSQSTTTQKSSATTSTSIAPVTSIVYSIQTITGSQETQVTTTQVVSTIISIPSNTASSGSDSNSNNSNKDSEKKNGFFQSPGKVAGTFTAVGVVAVALIGSLLYFCCLAKRQTHDDSDLESNASINEKSDNHPEPPAPLMSEPKDEPFSFVAVDQRLDPRQMFMKWENGSKNSLGDHQDYSRPRVLRVTNADAEVEE